MEKKELVDGILKVTKDIKQVAGDAAIVASGAISVGKDIVMEMKSEDGFDIMEVVDKEDKKLKNKTAVAQTTIKSALDGLSGLKKMFIKDRSITIYKA